jgi:hypothetical protein
VDGQSQRPACKKGCQGSEEWQPVTHGRRLDHLQGCKGGREWGRSSKVGTDSTCCGTDARSRSRHRPSNHESFSAGGSSQPKLPLRGRRIAGISLAIGSLGGPNGRRSRLLCPVAALRKSCSGVCRSDCSGGLPDTGGRVSRARLLASEVASAARPTQPERPRRATVVATEGRWHISCGGAGTKPISQARGGPRLDCRQ